MPDQPFAPTAEAPWEVVGEGVRRQVLAHGPDLMLVRVDFRAGAVGAVHHHPHRQVTWVAAGSFDVRVGAASRRLVAGDSFFAAAGVEHGVSALEEGTLIDVFTPAREDFLSRSGR
jgi:quercetin dioxygenase-like cupin family protein